MSDKEKQDYIFLLTFADKVLIGIILLVIGISSWWIFKCPMGGRVEIQTPNEVKKVNLSSKTQTIFAHGILGTTTIEIKQNKVRVIDSPCQNKICVKMGWKNKNGEAIVCVPNKVVVKIIKLQRQDVDAITE